MAQQKCTFEKEIHIVRQVRLNYLLFLPEGYNAGGARRWPLILFLHGAGERGDDLERVKIHGIPKVVEQRPDFPFVVVSPQCPRPSWWTAEVDALNALLDEVIATHAVDPARVYLTGLSMGGFGTWALAMAHPERFAAIAPICGGGDPHRVTALKDVPTWAFHGAQDEVVPMSETEQMVEALRAAGGDVRATVYPDADHDSWTATYDNPELYDWFLAHTR
ncbi:MAG: prolyl oligopeptidase family serine peptidase [Anaerolineae bacterium]